MATVEQVAQLRLIIDEPSSLVYSDDMLEVIIDQADGILDVAAAEVWQQKAARFSTLVDTSESGSSRAMSQMYKNAAAQAKYYLDKVTVTEEVDVVTPPRTRTAVRK